MDTLLVHVAGWKAVSTAPEMAWQPDAQVTIGETAMPDAVATVVAKTAMVPD